MKRFCLTLFALAFTAPVFAADPAHEAQLIVSAARQIQATHSGDYADLVNPTPVIDTAWGPLLAYSGAGFMDVHTTKAFGLHLDGIPQEDCVRFISAAAPRFSDVWVAGGSPVATGFSVFAGGHLNQALLDKACRADDSLGAEFITR